MVPLVYHPHYQRYCFGPEHPFSPVRLQMLLELLEALGVASPPAEPPIASPAEVLSIHDAAFVEQVVAASAGTPRPEAEHFGLGTLDVPVFDGMDAAARQLVGGTLHAARRVRDDGGKVLQLGGGLHHAQRALASGFCVYNDLAIAIHDLVEAGLRVAYIDIDVHHGDGVQWLHYADHRVLTISLHEAGQYLYPGTGAVHELGEGGGKGFKLNVPLEPNTMDDSYLETFERVVPHALTWYQPDVLVVMCGADAHFRDPLADLLLTTRAYEQLFRRLIELADSYAGGRAVFTLGGGYNFDAAVRIWTLLYLILQDEPLPEQLPEAWRTAWTSRLGKPITPTLHDAAVHFDVARPEAVIQQNRRLSQRLLELAAPYWY